MTPESTSVDSSGNLERLVRDGDQDALARLFSEHRGRLRRIISARLDDRLRGRVDESDVLQEAFIDMQKRLPTFAARKKNMTLFVWMRLVSVERVLATHRKHMKAGMRDVRRELGAQFASGVSSILADHLVSQFNPADDKLVRRELLQMLDRALCDMDDIDREIITMRCFEDISNAQTAEVLGISKKASSSRFVRAMARLKNHLNK